MPSPSDASGASVMVITWNVSVAAAASGAGCSARGPQGAQDQEAAAAGWPACGTCGRLPGLVFPLGAEKWCGAASLCIPLFPPFTECVSRRAGHPAGGHGLNSVSVWRVGVVVVKNSPTAQDWVEAGSADAA